MNKKLSNTAPPAKPEEDLPSVDDMLSSGNWADRMAKARILREQALSQRAARGEPKPPQKNKHPLKTTKNVGRDKDLSSGNWVDRMAKAEAYRKRALAERQKSNPSKKNARTVLIPDLYKKVIRSALTEDEKNDRKKAPAATVIPAPITQASESKQKRRFAPLAFAAMLAGALGLGFVLSNLYNGGLKGTVKLPSDAVAVLEGATVSGIKNSPVSSDVSGPLLDMGNPEAPRLSSSPDITAPPEFAAAPALRGPLEMSHQPTVYPLTAALSVPFTLAEPDQIALINLDPPQLHSEISTGPVKSPPPVLKYSLKTPGPVDESIKTAPAPWQPTIIARKAVSDKSEIAMLLTVDPLPSSPAIIGNYALSDGPLTRTAFVFERVVPVAFASLPLEISGFHAPAALNAIPIARPTPFGAPQADAPPGKLTVSLNSSDLHFQRDTLGFLATPNSFDTLARKEGKDWPSHVTPATATAIPFSAPDTDGFSSSGIPGTFENTRRMALLDPIGPASFGMLPEISAVPPEPIKAQEQQAKENGGPSDAARYVVRVQAPPSLSEESLKAFSLVLEETGYPVRSPKRVGFRVSKSHIRFYHAQDAEAAQKLADAIEGPARDFTDYSPRPPVGYIEVWLKGNAGSGQVARSTRRSGQGTSELTKLRNRLLKSLKRGDHL